MAYQPPVFALIRDNVLKSGNPLGLPSASFVEWADGLEIPAKGSTFLYTGLEYQLLPYLNGLQKAIGLLGPFGERLSMAKGLLGVFEGLGLNYLKVLNETEYKDLSTNILRQFVKVLRSAGVGFSYMYEDEPYAGSLMYELGFQSDLVAYGRRLQEIFAKHQVKELIVLSPHSLEMFRKVFPSLGITFDFTARHYLEVLKGTTWAGGPSASVEYSIHDPCHLARSLGIYEEPRELLKRIEGVSVREVTHTNKKYTSCCGAPIETYLPELAGALGQARIGELQTDGLRKVLVMCPFCLFNLKNAAKESSSDVEVSDLIETLALSRGG